MEFVGVLSFFETKRESTKRSGSIRKPCAPRTYSAQVTASSSSLIHSPSGWILTSRKSRMSGRCFKWCAGVVVRRATTCIPALTPASMPGRVSSKTRHSFGATPNRSAACRKPSGCGLPLRISSTGTITFGSGKPAAKTRASASVLHAEVTIAHEWFSSACTTCIAPGTARMPSSCVSS